MTDADAEPHLEALEKLMEFTSDPSTIDDSLAVHAYEASWLTTVLYLPLDDVENSKDIAR
ncbi:hypothetical protein K3217_21475 [bacterium BD-1]|nr:hypothetical protein [Ottowia caeni]